MPDEDIARLGIEIERLDVPVLKLCLDMVVVVIHLCRNSIHSAGAEPVWRDKMAAWIEGYGSVLSACLIQCDP